MVLIAFPVFELVMDSPDVNAIPTASGLPCSSSQIQTSSPSEIAGSAETIPGAITSAPLLMNRIAPISTVTQRPGGRYLSIPINVMTSRSFHLKKSTSLFTSVTIYSASIPVSTCAVSGNKSVLYCARSRASSSRTSFALSRCWFRIFPTIQSPSNPENVFKTSPKRTIMLSDQTLINSPCISSFLGNPLWRNRSNSCMPA